MDTAWTYEAMDRFVRETRTAVFVRRADNVLLIRPEKTFGVNESAATILEALYHRDGRGAAQALPALAARFGVGLDRIFADTQGLLETLGAMLRNDFSPRPNVRRAPFDRKRLRFPVLAEIALTYACQNRCAFCYAASPMRAAEQRPMDTAQVMRVMDRIFHEAHVPSLSFTGGEASLRPDLPALVRHGADLGFRTTLITNGIRCAEPGFVETLAQAGLAAAQVSIEAGDAATHDSLVGRPGAFADTVAGIGHLRRLGIHVHTNSTLCRGNVDRAADLVRFVRRELGLRTMSMNLLIRTGLALGIEPLSYTEAAQVLPGLLQVARAEGIKFVWYSPVPYCLMNPVLLGQGAKSCACVDGILSVDPGGHVLPCSSFQSGIGSLLHSRYEDLQASPASRYWRDKRFVPPVCVDCPDVDLCAGACPLYWDAAGSFAEIPRPGSSDPDLYLRWKLARRQGGSFGVACPSATAAAPAGEG